MNSDSLKNKLLLSSSLQSDLLLKKNSSLISRDLTKLTLKSSLLPGNGKSSLGVKRQLSGSLKTSNPLLKKKAPSAGLFSKDLLLSQTPVSKVEKPRNSGRSNIGSGLSKGASAKPSLFNPELAVRKASLNSSTALSYKSTLGNASSLISAQVKPNRIEGIEATSKRKLESREKVDKKKKTRDDFVESKEYTTSFFKDFEKEVLEDLKRRENEEKKLIEFCVKSDLARAKQEQIRKVDALKMRLVNSVSVALLRAPSMEDPSNEMRVELVKQINSVVEHDPEFILKLALYTRKNLNVRIVANFMLAYAAYLPVTRPYLCKYFQAAVALPSDWLNVAELYQTFFDKTIHKHALPTALRKVMMDKFPDFDEYQLAKYNKEKKKTKSIMVQKDDSIEFLPMELSNYTLKQMIRKLHISQPVQHVMAIIGKKYPENQMAFYQSKLPGNFKEAKAGVRMRLEIPETWETQVSLKGNKNETWQDLLDHNKLPFMAMLRNLRNMIVAGLQEKYHSKIIAKLKNKTTVINSKQFPFRFLSAYTVIEDLEKMLNASQQEVPAVANNKKEDKFAKKRRETMLAKIAMSNTFNQEILDRYKKALDCAIKISTVYNIEPIRGFTVICVDVGCLDYEKKKSLSTLENCILLALMCKFHSEGGEFALKNDDSFYTVTSINENSILENVRNLLKFIEDERHSAYKSFTKGFEAYFQSFTSLRKKVDNFVLLGDNFHDLRELNSLYWSTVNDHALFVYVSIGYSTNVFTSAECDYEVNVKGFSDQILRFVSTRGANNQLAFIENIDYVHSLQDIKIHRRPEDQKQSPNHSALTVARPVLLPPQQKWRSVRVFISSTFRDMHGERDLLTRHIFPELRRWCQNYQLNIYEVDLRWGITEKQANSKRVLDICLSEVSRADLFVGMVGDRYGWVPTEYTSTQSEIADWLGKHEAGLSITHLEMKKFLEKSSSNAFFYVRQLPNIKKIPKEFRKDFVDTKDSSNNANINRLRGWLYSECENIEHYTTSWGGVSDNKPMLSGLEHFGQSVTSQLWTAIKRNFLCPDDQEEPGDREEIENESEQQEEDQADVHFAFAKESTKKFVGKKSELTAVVSVLKEAAYRKDKNVVVVTGKKGAGKTAFMAKLVMENYASACCFFADVSETSMSQMLSRLFRQVNEKFNVGFEQPTGLAELTSSIAALLKTACKQVGSFYVFVDGIEKVVAQSSKLDWIPDSIPQGVTLVFSGDEHDPCTKQLLMHKQCVGVSKLGVLAYPDRALLVRQTLACHGKQLDESAFNNQMKLLISKRDASYPSYLRLACEEIRLFGVFERLDKYLRSLAQSVGQLVTSRMQQMEEEHGKQLVRDVFSLLYCSCPGLKEDEMFELLNVLRINKNTRVARVKFQNIWQTIKVFARLDFKTQSISLCGGEIADTVNSRYLSSAGRDYTMGLHTAFVRHYGKLVDPLQNQTYSGNDPQALAQLLHHMMCAGNMWKELKTTVCNLNFIDAKLKADEFGDLLDTFTCNNVKGSEVFTDDEEVKMTHQFLKENSLVFKKYPQLLWQQVINMLSTDNILAQQAASRSAVVGRVTWENKTLSNDNACALTISGIQKGVSSLGVDGERVLTGMEDGQILMFDRHTTKELQCLIGHTASVTCCEFAGNDRVCSAAVDGMVIIWDANTGQRLFSSKQHQRRVNALAVSPSARTFVTVSHDIASPAILWTVSDGKPALKYINAVRPLNCAAFHPSNQNLVAMAGWDRKVIVWDTVHGKNAQVFSGHTGSIQALAYSPCSTYLASSSLNGEVFLWSAKSGNVIGQMPHVFINSLVFTKQHLIGASNHSSLMVWNSTLGCPGKIYESVKAYAMTVAVSDDFIAIGYNDGSVAVHAKNSELKTREWEAHASTIRSACFIGTHLVTAGDDCVVKRWDVNSQRLISTMQGHTAPVKCVAARESLIVSASEDSSVRVWPGIHFETNEGSVSSNAVMHGHTGHVTCCDLSSCESMAVSVSIDKSLIIWSMASHTALVHVHQAHAGGIQTVSWSDVGDYLVTGGNDFLLKLWDAKFLVARKDNQAALKEKVTFKGHQTAVNSVKYKFGCVASSSTDGVCKVWTHKGVEVTSIKAHALRVNACDVHQRPQKQKQEWFASAVKQGVQEKIRTQRQVDLVDVLLYTASDDMTVRSFQPFKPHLACELFGHSDTITDLRSFQASVVTSSHDKTVKLWDLQALCNADKNHHHKGEVSGVAVHGTLSASCGRDGVLKLFEGNALKFNARVCEKALTTVLFGDEDTLFTGDSTGCIRRHQISQQGMGSETLQKLESGIVSLKALSHDRLAVMDIRSLVVVNKQKKTTIGDDSYYELLAASGDHIARIKDAQILMQKIPVQPEDHSAWQKRLSTRLNVDENAASLCHVTSMCLYGCSADVILAGTRDGRLLVTSKERLEKHAAGESDYLSSDDENDDKDDVTAVKDKNVEFVHQIHESSVTGIFQSDDVIVTCSKDCTIKVWRLLRKDGGYEMKQLGMFYLASPPTSLAGRQSADDTLRLVIGCNSGAVEHLSVVTSV